MFEKIKNWIINYVDYTDNHTWRFQSERVAPKKMLNQDNHTWRFRK